MIKIIKKKCNIIFWFITFLSITIFSGCGSNVNSQKNKSNDSGIICNFENVKLWDISPEQGFSLRLSKKYITEGKYSLKVVYPKGGLPSINTRKLTHDWDVYDSFCFDVFNPQDALVDFVVRLDDENRKRTNLEYPLNHGWNNVEILKDAIDRKINSENISFVVLYLKEPSKRITLYFDNMRLIKSQMSTDEEVQIIADGKKIDVNDGIKSNSKTIAGEKNKTNIVIKERFEPIIIKNNLPKKGEIRVPVVKFANKEVKDVLVSNGIPFAPGQLFSENDFSVFNDNGEEISIAVKVLAKWTYDGSIRSMLVQFPLEINEKFGRVVLKWGNQRNSKDIKIIKVDSMLPEAFIALPVDWLCQSQIIGEQIPIELDILTRKPVKKYDKNIYKYYPKMRDVPLIGDIRKDGFYNTPHVFYQLYVRSGDENIFKSARRELLNYRDNDIILRGSNRGRHIKFKKTRYIYLQAMVDDYLLTGDEKSLKIARYMAEYLKDNFSSEKAFFAKRARNFWTEREAAFPFLGVITYYELTGDTEYLNYASQIMKNLYKTQLQWPDKGGFIHNLYSHDPEEGCRNDEYGGSPFMTGLLLEAIVKYHKLTGSNIAKDSIFCALDWLMDDCVAPDGRSFVYLTCDARKDEGHPDLNMLVVHAFGYGYKISDYKRKDYLDFGKKIFNYGAERAYLNRRKHFNQNYRSSGHFLGYIEKSK